MSNFSGDATDQDLLEDGVEWYPDDAAPENPVLCLAKEKIKGAV